MSLNFNTVLEINQKPLWTFAEKTLDFGQKRYVVKTIHDRNIEIQKSEKKKTSKQWIAAKLIFSFTVGLFLTIAATITKAIYRHHYNITVLQDLIPEENPLQGEALEIAMKKNAYQIDQIIARIHQSQAEGKKIALFAGRDNSQSLPQEEGWEWFSLDVELKNADYQKHLIVDLNNYIQLSKIRNLFDKVVLDFSVLKFIVPKPWEKMHLLLKPAEDSELIIESASPVSSFTHNPQVELDPENAVLKIPFQEYMSVINKNDHAFNEWKKREGTLKVEEAKEEFLERRKQEEEKGKDFLAGDEENEFKEYILRKENLYLQRPNHYDELRLSIENFLKDRYFDHVELHRHELYPYRTGNEAVITDFWRLRSPKLLGV